MNIDIASQKIKRIMKDNCFKRRVLTTTGRIEFERLPFHKTSKLLFSRESERKGKSYHVELLLDASGSMWKIGAMGLACQSVEYFAKAMGKYCDLNLTLFNYLETRVRWQDFDAKHYADGDSYGQAVEVQDHLGRRLIVPKSHAEHYPKRSSPFNSRAGNWELTSVLNAAERLRSKKGHKIILIALDGFPNFDYHQANDPIYVAGRRIDKLPRDTYRKNIERISRDISVIGFGINTNAPEQYYPNFYQINDADEILPTLITALSNLIAGKKPKPASPPPSTATPYMGGSIVMPSGMMMPMSGTGKLSYTISISKGPSVEPEPIPIPF